MRSLEAAGSGQCFYHGMLVTGSPGFMTRESSHAERKAAEWRFWKAWNLWVIFKNSLYLPQFVKCAMFQDVLSLYISCPKNCDQDVIIWVRNIMERCMICNHLSVSSSDNTHEDALYIHNIDFPNIKKNMYTWRSI